MSNKKKKKNNIKKKKDVPIEALNDMSAEYEYGDKAWNILEHAIRRIYNHKARNILSFEELYRFFLINVICVHCACLLRYVVAVVIIGFRVF
jgi:hypothetical protein